jgi:DNA-binding NtrC family response regulator
VLVVDDDHDLRDVLGAIVTELCDRACLSAASFADLVALGDRALSCDVAILDVNLGPDQPSGIDVYEWLQGHGFQGRIAFLTGHARTHPAVARAHDVAHVYQKPVTLETVRSIVEGST